MRSSGRWLDAQAQIPTEVTKVKVILGKNLAGKVTNLKYEEWTTGTWIFSMCLCMNVRRFNVSYWCARTKGLNTDISLLSLPFKTILLIWAKVLNVAPKQNKRLFKQWTFLVIYAGYEGADIAEFFLQWSLPSHPPLIIIESILLFIYLHLSLNKLIVKSMLN